MAVLLEKVREMFWGTGMFCDMCFNLRLQRQCIVGHHVHLAGGHLNSKCDGQEQPSDEVYPVTCYCYSDSIPLITSSFHQDLPGGVIGDDTAPYPIDVHVTSMYSRFAQKRHEQASTDETDSFKSRPLPTPAMLGSAPLKSLLLPVLAVHGLSLFKCLCLYLCTQSLALEFLGDTSFDDLEVLTLAILGSI